jgi:predicted DsbA family dithiol-disulfide isomerase
VPVHVSYVTDPACPASWGAEPTHRRLLAEFGDEVAITYVMGGIARRFDRPLEQLRAWLDAAERSAMPVDARMWLDDPPKSSYPACLAVKAAAEQGRDAAYLRRLREGFAVEGRRLDTPDALVAAAGEVDGLHLERFRVDLGSNAIVELFGTDLDRARARPEQPAPRWEVDGEVVEDVVGAVRAAGAAPGPLPGVEDALRRFGRMTTAEVAAVCDLPGPRAPAELWRLALEWRVRPDAAPAPRFWSIG